MFAYSGALGIGDRCKLQTEQPDDKESGRKEEKNRRAKHCGSHGKENLPESRSGSGWGSKGNHDDSQP